MTVGELIRELQLLVVQHDTDELPVVLEVDWGIRTIARGRLFEGGVDVDTGPACVVLSADSEDLI